MPVPPSRVGRPPADSIPRERRRHLLALAGARILHLPLEVIAMRERVSTRTVKNWTRRAKGYPEAATRESLAAAVSCHGNN